MEKATFAGGCFWCMVTPFDQLPGIHKIVSGYMGGHIENPIYEDVKNGETGHYEVVEITFDAQLFSYEKLLNLYWPQIDPTDDGGQFHDRGPQYKTAIFYHNEEQRIAAEKSKKNLIESGRFKDKVVTEIIEATKFYEAEEYHQDYHKKNPAHYKEDRKKSGRDEFMKQNWIEG